MIRRFLFVLLTCAGLLAASHTADADVAAGAVDGGYTLGADGYWWSGNAAYTRQLYQSPGYTYYYCGRAYYAPGSSYYSYAFSHYRQPAAAKVQAKAKGWRELLVEQALSERREAAEQKNYLEALQLLGFAGRPGYTGSYNAYGATPNLAYGNYGSQGQTLYGYTYQSLKEAYGDNTIPQAMQASARLAQGARDAANDANTQFNSNVQALADNMARLTADQARIAEIRERATAAARLFAATEPQARTREQVTVQGNGTSNTYTQSTQQSSSQSSVTAPAGSAADLAAFQKFAQTKCGACHGDARPEGKFKISEYLHLSKDDMVTVLDRITTSDDSKRMPKSQGGKAAQPLTDTEFLAFVRAWAAANPNAGQPGPANNKPPVP
jgi:hypothetical protein